MAEHDVLNQVKSFIFNNETGGTSLDILLKRHRGPDDPTIGAGLSMNEKNWPVTKKILEAVGVLDPETVRSGKAGITEQQMKAGFDISFTQKLTQAIGRNSNFVEMPIPAIVAQLDLMYQSGTGFKKTLKLIEQGDFLEASKEITRSGADPTKQNPLQEQTPKRNNDRVQLLQDAARLEGTR